MNYTAALIHIFDIVQLCEGATHNCRYSDSKIAVVAGSSSHLISLVISGTLVTSSEVVGFNLGKNSFPCPA